MLKSEGMVVDQVQRDNASPIYIEEYLEDALNITKDKETPKKKRSMRYYERGRRWDNARSTLKGSGARHQRRTENLNFLLSMAKESETESVDLYEPGYSVFATLLQNPNKMEIWNDFLNHTEEEQDAYLCTEEWTQTEPQCTPTASKDDGPEILNKDEREVHPAALSAEESFARIDGHLKRLLRRKQTPKGVLASLEEDLIEFFTQWPDSVYISRLASGFERMFLYALCQYMDLQAQSRSQGKQRHTHVENKNPEFKSPRITLTQFLQPEEQS